MSVGGLFLVGAALICFLTGAGIFVIPGAVLWALFCLALGMLLGGVTVWHPRGTP